MIISELDPLVDARWPEFVRRHPDAGIFHSRGWLQALRASYGYRPVVFTTLDQHTLSGALVCCVVKSALTGRRLVSLPFSDHCQPLARGDELDALINHVSEQLSSRRWKYVELRPMLDVSLGDYVPAETYHLHTINLTASLDELYANLHSSCIRRKIKKAERERLVYEAGRSPRLLEQFRTLLLVTRRRHGLPPQPMTWFRNLLRYLGDELTIHVVSKDNRPVASIVTLRHKGVLTYKYGCSDLTYSHLGGTPLLFWRAMQQAKADGLEQFDLGRSDADDAGLTAFKEHLGATASELVYRRRSPGEQMLHQPAKAKASETKELMRKVLVRLPDPLFSGVGQLLYRHFG